MKLIKMKLLLLVVLNTTMQVNSLLAQSGASLKLIYPAKGQSLKEPFPTFTWTPPVDASGQYTYDLRVVEVLEHQSPEAAMMANPEWFSAKKLSVNSHLYLPASPLLQGDKEYAWQVTARATNTANESRHIREWVSEVYWFKPAANEIEICAITPVKANTDDKSFYLLENPLLRFRFPEEVTGNEEWRFTITDKHNHPIDGIKKVVPEFIDNGDYHQLALNQYSYFRKKECKKKLYHLDATNGTGEKYRISFMLN